MANTLMYYTYLYYDPKTTKCRYVGIGMIRRARSHLRRSTNPQLHTMIQKRLKEGFDIEPILIEADSVDDAKDMEKLLISMIGREDLSLGPLFNHTDGGDGTAGHGHGSTTKERIGKASMKMWQRPGHREAVSTAVKASHAKPEMQAKFKRFAGCHHTASSKAQISRSKQGVHLSNAHKEAISKTLTGSHLSEETKRKMSATIRGTNTPSKYHHWLIQDPRGQVHQVSCVKVFCADQGISVSGLQGTTLAKPCLRGLSAGWRVIEKVLKRA